MKTITTCVHDIIRHQPFLDDAIARDIVNFSGLAEDLRPEVEKEMRKPVKVGSIIMALRRYAPKRTKINMNSLLYSPSATTGCYSPAQLKLTGSR